MAMTRLQLKNNIASFLERPGDTDFLTFLDGRLDQMLFVLFDMHDWNWKHKLASFNTVAATESYDLSNTQRIYHGSVTGGPFVAGEVIHNVGSTATGTVVTVGSGYLIFISLTGAFISGDVITGSTSSAFATATTGPYGGITGIADLRSNQDIEVMWDSTNKRFLDKVDLHTIRKQYPEGSQSGKPTRYAPWGVRTVFLDNIPDDTYTMNFLYTAKATIPTADGDDLETVCGVPDYCHFLLEKMVLAEAMLIDNDTRRDNLLIEIYGTPGAKGGIWKKLAVDADMRHLESTARFKFWEEELQPAGVTYDDYLRHVWWDE